MRRPTAPIFREREKIEDTGSRPAILYLPMADSPAEAMQPHSEHNGVPPNWQGETAVRKSAEKHAVVCAKMHSSGELGGFRKPSRIWLAMFTFGNSSRTWRMS